MDDQAGDRLRRAAGRPRGRRARAADLGHADPAQARVLAAAHRRTVLPADRDPSWIRPGGSRPLVRDAGRRPAQTGGGGPGAERAALLLCADHGDLRRGAAVGAEDPDDHAGHRRRVHLPQAVPAPVRRGRVRRDRSDRPGRSRPQPGRRDRPGQHQGRGDARRCPASPAYRAARWARRNPAQAAGLALGAATRRGNGRCGRERGGWCRWRRRPERQGPAGPIPPRPESRPGMGSVPAPGPWVASAGASSGDQAPPLRLPSSQGTPASWSGGSSSGGPASGGRGRPASSRNGNGSGGSGSPPPAAPPALTLGGPAGSRWPSGSSGSAGQSSGGAATRRPSAAPPSPPSAPSPPPVASSRTPAGSGGGWSGRGQAPRSVRPTGQPTESARPRSAAPPRGRSGAPPSSSAPRSGGPFWSGRSGGSGSAIGPGGRRLVRLRLRRRPGGRWRRRNGWRR